MFFAFAGAARRLPLAFLSSFSVVILAASCSVYDDELLSTPTTGGKGGTGGAAGALIDAGRGGSTDSGVGGSTGGKGGSTDGSADATGGRAGTRDGGGASGTGGTGRGGSGGTSGAGGGGAGVDGSAGTAGGGGTGGVAGSAGAGGATGAGGGGTSGAGGGAGTAGAGGAGGSSGAGGTAGAAGAGGTAGSGGGGTGGAPDAGPDLPPPGAVFAVGSFAKMGTTGNQTVTHPLGQAPKALLLWTARKTNETAGAGFSLGVGVSDGSASFSVAADIRNGVAASGSHRRMAAKALTLVQYDGAVLAEADVNSFNASNFVLNWTANSDTAAHVVHYIAIGGPQVSAKVVNWQAPTGAGNRAVTGVGFQPETVLHLFAGAAFATAPPSASAHGVFGLGVMDRGGAQWVTTFGDTNGSNPTVASRAQKTDSAIFMTSGGPTFEITKQATFVSMDTGGFTVNFTSAGTSNVASQIISLALGGLKAKAGTFNKSTAAQPASQGVTSVGFLPGAVLLASDQAVTQTAPVEIAQARFGMGASDGPREGSSAFCAADAVSPSNSDSVDKTSKVFMKMDNASVAIDAEADLTSLDPTGFTLSWSKNDTIATQIGYWALGKP